MSGIFFAVVGASGVGKDTVIGEAKFVLDETGRYHFPQRIITRAPDEAGENHQSVTVAQFQIMQDEDAFCLSWRAHELYYGLPKEIFKLLQKGRHVVANISRKSVLEAAGMFENFEVLEIIANPEARAERLQERARETADQIANRQARKVEKDWAGDLTVSEIDNNGTVKQAVDVFVETVLSLSDRSAAPAQRA
ncbi:MAG: phosphonate metabolism protein/1,5-bisphosphokinase (PRPP-forming) PhnN [Pseudomonadota bacterium]